jgi:hypothetical protein
MYDQARDCKHGRLARSCEVCDLEKTVAEQAVKNEKLKATVDQISVAMGNEQLTRFIEKFGEPVPIVLERDQLRAEVEQLKQKQAGSVGCIRSLTDQCHSLIQERDELQKQVWRYEKDGVTRNTLEAENEPLLDGREANAGLRADIERAPWVIDEVKKQEVLLRQALDALLSLDGVGTVIGWHKQWEKCHAVILNIKQNLREP